MNTEAFLKQEYLGNTVKEYLITVAIIVVGLVAIRLIKKFLLKKLHAWSARTETVIDDYVVKGVERFALPVMSFVVIYWGLNMLSLSPRVTRVVEVATALIITFFILRLISTTIELVLKSFLNKQEGGEEKIKQIPGIMLIVNMVVWAIGLLALFDNLGYDVTTIIAGLGIGGIAIALAAQNILGDLFNYFVIFFDRPFEVGDFVTVDDKKGTVENIGIKTTRLKSLTGEQLIVSNSDLTKSRLHNFKRMDRRRIIFTFGVTYQTKADKLREIPGLVKQFIEAHPKVTFDRAHFSSYGASSLNFEVVYFVESAEYNDYMDIQQSVNLKIFEEFEKRGIQFAYPTQTIFLEKGAVTDEK
ncbi:MAG TPA: mechanosensitive ion channel family protein [Ohtaekwangia sp.]